MTRSFIYVFLAALLTSTLLFHFPARAQNRTDTTAQRDLIDYMRKWLKLQKPRTQDDASRRIRFSIFPVSSKSQNRITFSAVNIGFYRGHPSTTNLSTVYFYPYTNFSGRYSFNILSGIWTEKNRWNAEGDLKISSNSYDDYGLGSRSSSDSVNELNYNQYRIHIEVSRRVVNFFYAGLGYYLDRYDDISQTPADSYPTDFSTYPYGTASSHTASGLVLNLKRDSRKNSNNPQGGYYTSFSFRFYNPAIGSTYSWNAFYADARKYFPVQTKLKSILAARVLYWQASGEVPYLELPATFNDRESRAGRGYPFSRFRGKAMAYAETEYRFPLSAHQLWGGVVFVNAQSMRDPESGNFDRINPAAGFGLRMKFNKRSGINLTLDFAFGRDSFAWYLNLGEFF